MTINDSVLIWTTLGIYNLAIFVLLRKTFSSVSLANALREKSEDPPSGAGDAANTSYSRVAGMLGAVVIGCLVWGFGNVVLARAITNPSLVKSILDGVWPFILSTSALFAPYAFNQVKDGMQPKAPPPAKKVEPPPAPTPPANPVTP